MSMAGHDMVHVAMAPPDTVEAGLAEKVAPVVKKDLFGARLLLGSKIPRIVGHYQTLQAAESIAQSLRSLGLVAVVCHDSELRQPSSGRFRAHTLELGEGKTTFRDRGRQARVIEAKSVFLILKGMVQTQTETETTTSKMKFSLPATLLTGGIPIWRKVDEKSKNQSVQTDFFVRLYDRKSPEPGVEIFQHDFDYSGLGAKMTSSPENLNTLVAELRNRFPEAVFDSRLTEHFGVEVPFATPGDAIEINCKLIYLCHQAAGSPGPSA
jgi:hypothetical protein